MQFWVLLAWAEARGEKFVKGNRKLVLKCTMAALVDSGKNWESYFKKFYNILMYGNFLEWICYLGKSRNGPRISKNKTY